jgi:ribosome biogenesis GTPase A
MNTTAENTQENQLRHFTLAKQQVGDLLRSGLQLFQKNDNETKEDQCRALLVKLAEDRFNLVVVGQFKRGKSSLMNAIIGRDLLPTGLLPLTSAITTLCYGPNEKVSIKRSGWGLKQEISFSELAEYVTEQGNPGNTKGVIEARIELPIPFLRRGLFFIDTPGIGSARSENTATTYAFLPQSDAVIFVTSVEAPLSEPEEAFLRDVQQYARRLFVVVNKVDLLADHEVDQVFAYIKTGVSKILGSVDIRLYPLSARLALESKLRTGNSNDGQKGLESLEADLNKFLAEEKSQLFLISILDQLLRVVSDAVSTLPSVDNLLDEDRASLLKLQTAIVNLRDSILNDSESLPEPFRETTQPSEIVKSQLISPIQQRPASFKTRICPICASLSQATFDFFAKYQSDLVEEAEVRKAFVGSKGFCKVHTWQFEKISSPQGISEGYVTWVEKVASELRQTAHLPSMQQKNQIDKLLSDSENCLACKTVRESEAVLLEQFIDYIATQEGQEYYRRSLGLCLPHLRKAFAINPSSEIKEFLLIEQARHFEELSEDMHSYTLKRDAIRSSFANDNEDNAWMYALIQLVGARTVQN